MIRKMTNQVLGKVLFICQHLVRYPTSIVRFCFRQRWCHMAVCGSSHKWSEKKLFSPACETSHIVILPRFRVISCIHTHHRHLIRCLVRLLTYILVKDLTLSSALLSAPQHKAFLKITLLHLFFESLRGVIRKH